MIPFELRLAWRFVLSRRKHPFIGVVSKISTVGIAIGVGALIIVLSVMTGFEKDLLDRVVGTYSHLSVESDRPFTLDHPKIEEVLDSLPSSARPAFVFQSQALLRSPKSARGVVFRGISEQEAYAATELQNYITKGTYPEQDSDEIMIGQPLAQILHLRVGDSVDLFSGTDIRPQTFKVSGYFKSGMYEYDTLLIYGDLDRVSRLYGAKGEANQLAVLFDNPKEALNLKSRLQKAAGYFFFVRTWADMNRSLFDAIRLEKTVMFIILSLIVLVACFNIIGTLMMTVMERTREIGILRALGCNRKSITCIFFLIGIYHGTIGAILGFVFGYAVCDFLKRTSIISIPSDVYYFDRLPVAFDLAVAGQIMAAAFVLTLLSAIYPAVWAAQRPIAESLRYE